MAVERRVAVDTSVLVNYFTNGGTTDDPSWFEHSAWVMTAAQRGQFRLVVPALALAELAGDGTVRGAHLPPKTRHERVQNVLKWTRSAAYVLVADVDLRVARQAVDLAIKHQLRGGDACIVACALMARATTLYSWDGDHLKLDGAIDGLTIRQPEAQAHLQGDLLESLGGDGE
jgi:predicted nucleic acid-binding protein